MASWLLKRRASSASPALRFRVLNGAASISIDMDLRLSKALNTTAGMWLKMQTAHDLWNAQRNFRAKVEPIVRDAVLDDSAYNQNGEITPSRHRLQFAGYFATKPQTTIEKVSITICQAPPQTWRSRPRNCYQPTRLSGSRSIRSSSDRY